MGVSSGPKLVTDGLIAVYDPNNRRSTIESMSSSFINQDSWADGQTGSVGSYGANETSGTENARVNATDPWGDTAVVWETRASGDGNNDGGWNTGYYTIDPTKLYRFSVWMRRTSSSSGGTFYFGLYGQGPTWGVKNYTGGTEGNPYWQCVSPSNYTQNQWYLHVGHCYPAGTTITGWHPESGIYLPNTTLKNSNMSGCNITYDPAWFSDTYGAYHRTYHFYCNDSTTRLQFAYPRIDVCNGTQPTIAELVTAKTKQIKNLIDPTQYNLTISAKGGANINKTTASGLIAKIFNLDGTSALYAATSDLNLSSQQYTIIAAARYKGSTNGRIVTAKNNNWLLGHWGNTTENHYAEGWVSNVSSGTYDTNWRILACSGNPTSDSWKMYVNGALTYSNSGGSAGPNQLTFNNYTTEPTDGEAGIMYVYNRVLSDDEIKRCYQALRGRFGI